MTHFFSCVYSVTRDISAMSLKLAELQLQVATQQNFNQNIQSQVSEKMLEKQLLAQKVIEPNKLTIRL
jgi:hypothetical protein